MNLYKPEYRSITIIFRQQITQHQEIDKQSRTQVKITVAQTVKNLVFEENLGQLTFYLHGTLWNTLRYLYLDSQICQIVKKK